MHNPDCVGALIFNAQGKLFIQRRSPTRRVFPGVWDIVGGHVEPGETPEEALRREIAEETGWQLHRILARVVDWEWQHDGVLRREADYLIEVNGDLSAPRLEPGKHDAIAWVGLDDLDLLNEGRDPADVGLRQVVERALKFHQGLEK